MNTYTETLYDSYGQEFSIDKVYFENYCDDCMGWDVKSFNVEMTEPVYMKIQAYPYAWTESSKGVEIGVGSTSCSIIAHGSS